MKKLYLILCLFFLSGVFLRLPFVEKFQSHWDGPQYSIGIVDYDFSQETPSTPGYPLYIGMGRLFYEFVNDPHYALLLVSVLFAGIGSALMYITGKIIFNKTVGIIASFLFLSGPTFYFFGLTAYAYGIMPAIATGLALCVYLISVKKRGVGIVLGLIFAFALGVRPQEFLMFTPLFLLGLYYLPKQQRLIALTGFFIFMVIWTVPFLFFVGGVGKYLNSFLIFANQGAFQQISLDNSLTYAARMLKGSFLTFTVSIVFLGFYLYHIFKILVGKKFLKTILKNNKILLFLTWIIPSMIINLFIRSDHAGYQMTYLSGLVILIAYAQYCLFKKHKKVLSLVVILCIAFNLFWFFRDRDVQFKGPYIPTSFHYSEIRKNDIKLGSKVVYVNNHFMPEKTIIITTPDPWRPLMYHLKPFTIYSIDALITQDQKFIDIVRISKNWKREEKRTKLREFIVPDKIESIVLVDDEAEKWLKVPEKKVIDLPGQSKITVLKVHTGQKVVYDYLSVKIRQ